MKDQILKIAKVKSEKEFYKKYPTEEAFMKAHKKEFKKAAMGSKMVNDQLHQLTDFGNPPIAQKGTNLVGNSANAIGWGNYQPTVQPATYSNWTGLVGGSKNAAGQEVVTKAATDAAFGEGNLPEGAGGGGIQGKLGGAAMAGLNALPGIIGGIEAIGAQKKARKKAEQATQLSGLALTAQQTMEKPKNQYVRPEDNMVQPGQMGDPYGNNTNYLQAQNGTMIGGNPTEIQNTYAPTGDMYQDLGFEPLEETYKQYRHGGEMPKAEFGEYFQDSGEAQIGSSVGTAAGSLIGGPIGGAIGGLIGKGLGNVFGGAKNARKLQAEKDKTAMNQSMMGFMQNRSQGPLSANLEHGGWISHDWQPQTFTKFGEYSAKDLLKPPHDADMLRSGGHLAQVGYTAPSAEALYTGRPDMPNAQNGVQMAMGGDLEIGEGGRLETLSYNPNLPGGEIGMFRGASHDNGGIKTKYGENEVEVEGNEPVVKLQDGGSTENLVVFGNIKINKEIADLMGDPKAKGKKFKTYIADIAKNDAKQLKRINKGLELVQGADENSAFDHLTLNTGKAIMQGAKAWQKINADKIKEAGLVQDSIHQTARELGVKSDKLAEGKLEKETDPSMMAQNGITLLEQLKGLSDEELMDPEHPERMEALKAYMSGNKKAPYQNAQSPNFTPFTIPTFGKTQESKTAPKSKEAPKSKTALYNYSSGPKYKTGKEIVDAIMQDALKGVPKNVPNEFIQIPYESGRGSNELQDVIVSGSRKKSTPVQPILEAAAEDKKGFDWKGLGMAALSNIAPWLRPSNANEELNPDQLMGEYYALANNQLDPVQSQQYQPMLDTPYDISFNDQINAIDSQSRAALRASGSNPAAQAMIMAQTIEAKNKLFGESNRVNQANKMGVYDKNRAIINDAKLKNLAINDQQYVRQSQSKSNTKAQTQAALNSISAKVAQQRASNRKLGVMENMYNFRFTPSGRAINYNGLALFDTSGANARRYGLSSAGLAANKRFTIDSVTGEPVGIRTLTKDEMAGNTPSLSEIDGFLSEKNGGKTSKTKARNSSIVKALKSL